jgi:geranylgeranyl diphosphate synthase type I
VELASHFAEMSLSLTEGQFLDMEFEGREDVSPEEYLDMIGRKTSSLIEFSCRAGGIVGGAAEKSIGALAEFGVQLGKAFQIRDDIRGIWGKSGETGKEAAKDLQNRKKTLPILLALGSVDPRDRAQLSAFFAHSSDDLDKAVSILSRSDVRAEAERVLEARLAAAVDCLQTAELDHRHRWRLSEFATELTS